MKKLALITSSILLLAVYQNCGQGGFNVVNSSDLSSLSAEDGYLLTNPVALLTYEQVFKSMASQTGVDQSNNNVSNEYNTRSAVLASGFELKTITSPMLIGITNLGSTFCSEAFEKDKAAMAEQRRFFLDLDFTKGPSFLSDAAYNAFVQRMALAFWGRLPTGEEFNMLLTARTDFLADYSPADLTNAGNTKNLVVFTCTAMLASTDSYTF